MSSPYDILGLPPSATLDEVKQRYKELAKKNHPDKLHHLPAEERAIKEEFFKKVTVAYHILCESAQRGDSPSDEQGTAHWKHLWSLFAQDKADLWAVFKNTMSDVATKYQNIHSKEHHVACNVTLKELKLKDQRKLRLFLQGVLNPVFVTLDCSKYPEMMFTAEEVHVVHIHMKLVEHDVYSIEAVGENLHLTCEIAIGFHEFFAGCERTLETVDGRTLPCTIPSCMDLREPICIPGEGIRGDLWVYVILKPVCVMRWNALSTEEKENVVRCLEQISL